MAKLVHKASHSSKKNLKNRPNKRKNDSGIYSGYLYPYPDVWYGAASTFDLFGLLDDFNYSRNGREADAKGLQSDYYAIAHDLWRAIWLFEDEHSLEELPKQYRLFDPDETKRIS